MIKRKNFIPTKYTFICSEHFIPDNYQIRPGASVRLLKDDAYPTVFNGYQKEYNIREVQKNKSSLRVKLSKLVLFKNL